MGFQVLHLKTGHDTHNFLIFSPRRMKYFTCQIFWTVTYMNTKGTFETQDISHATIPVLNLTENKFALWRGRQKESLSGLRAEIRPCLEERGTWQMFVHVCSIHRMLSTRVMDLHVVLWRIPL